nr:MAG: hypothetical protein TU35_03710 [Thermoproteus sp. AZ2]
MRVKYASLPITPPPGLKMDGYISRIGPARGPLDDLYLRTAELDGVFLASLDLVAVNPVFSRRGAVAATHTHSGPSICHYAMSWGGCGEGEGRYVLGLSRLISSAEPQPLRLCGFGYMGRGGNFRSVRAPRRPLARRLA